MVIFVDGTEELQSKIQDVKRFNKGLEVDKNRHNYYCKCGESNAVYLEGKRQDIWMTLDVEFIIVEDVEFIIVDCKNCKSNFLTQIN